MQVELTVPELNLILSAIGLALNYVQDTEARDKLLDLQTKLMELRGN